MTVSLPSLKRLATLGLSTEQMAAVLEVLAVELAPLEDRRMKDRDRKIRKRNGGNSDDDPPTFRGQAAENPGLARERDNISSRDNKNSPPQSPPVSADFRAFWEAYPKRDGGADEAAAEKAFAAAVRRIDPQVIIAGAAAYAAEMRRTGKIGTQYVSKARKWLNDAGWRDYDAKPAVVPQPRVMVFEGTPAWKAWERTGRRIAARDLKDEHGRVIGRGWYFESEFPPEEKAA